MVMIHASSLPPPSLQLNEQTIELKPGKMREIGDALITAWQRGASEMACTPCIVRNRAIHVVQDPGSFTCELLVDK